MFELLSYTFMQKAFVAGIAVGFSCSLIGVFLLLKRMALISDGIAHSAFAGLAIGLLLGTNPSIVGMVVAILTALFVHKLKNVNIYSDIGIAIIFALGLAIGAICLSFYGKSNIDITGYMFGSILAIGWEDVYINVIIAVIVLISILALQKELLFISFDEETARASNIKTETINTFLMILSGITIITAIKTTGILLVSSITVMPASIAILTANSFVGALVISCITGVFSVISGITISFYVGVPTGATITIIQTAFFILALLTKKLNIKKIENIH